MGKNSDSSREFYAKKRLLQEASGKAAVEFVSLDDAAVELGYRCVKSVRRHIDSGKLPKTVVVGGRMCFERLEFEGYKRDRIEKREEETRQLRQRRLGKLVGVGTVTPAMEIRGDGNV